MGQQVAARPGRAVDKVSGEELKDFVTFTIDKQLFGIPVLRVQDILVPDRIAPIPLAPVAVKGSINLRGRIVTVLDVRVRLGLDPRSDDGQSMGVTVEYNNDLYTLLVDQVGDVVRMADDCYESNPTTLDALWREFAAGVYRMDKMLLVVLDVDRLLDLDRAQAA